jgi:hypothetical protein
MKPYLPYLGIALLLVSIGGWVALAEDGHVDKEERIIRIEKYVEVEIQKLEDEEAIEEYTRELCDDGRLTGDICDED